MRIPSGKTDQVIYFVARDSATRARKTGLSSFTAYRSRNGGAATVYTTPTVTEVDATNMPGLYKFLIDEDTTIASGSDSEEMALHITATNMQPVTRTVELYRRDTTSGATLATADVTAIKAKTDNLPSDPADESLIIAATDALASSIAALPTTTVVNAIKAKTDNLPASPAATGDIPTADQNADALLDRSAGIETGWTFREAMRVILAVLAGKASGMATTTAVFRDVNDSKDRVTATVDEDGNRSAVTRDAT